MKQGIIRAAACILAVVLALGTVRLVLEKTMPADTSGTYALTEEAKITGRYLTKTAAEQENTLNIFGSSELKTTDICTNPANFFADGRFGVQVNLVGRGSCQSLIHALAIAGNADAMEGKQVVLITAPQSYVEEGIAPDLFMANYSPQQLLWALASDKLPQSVKTYLAQRTQSLIAQYNAENDTRLEVYSAATLEAKAVLSENQAAALLVSPFAFCSRWLLDTRDLAQAKKLVQENPAAPLQDVQTPDWDEELALAMEQAGQMVTGNDYSMQDSYYDTYVGKKLAQFEGKDASLSYADSPEYDDLRCLLEICQALSMDVLFVHVPMNGAWCDYTGFSAQKRQSYYDAVRKITEEFSDVTMLDLTDMEYEPYTLCDTMHLGWKGWLAVDRAIYEFSDKDKAVYS